MSIKRVRHVLILAALLLATFAGVPASFPEGTGGQGESDILLQDLLWNMEWAQQSVRDMTFVFVAAAAKGSSIDKFNEDARQSGGASLPEETSMSVWIKKPDKMKIVAGDYKIIIRREARGLFSYQYDYATGRAVRQKLPQDAWPVWPSQERIVANLKKYMVKNTPCTILRDDAAAGGAAYVLTFKPGDTKEEYAYVIRIADWRILKSVFYENGQASFSAEWRDIAVNTRLADKVFEAAEANDTAAAQNRPRDAVPAADAANEKIEVVYAGVVKKEIVQKEGGYALKDNSRYLRVRQFVEEKDIVPGTLGTAFGLAFTVKGDSPLSLTARYLHPPMANPLTREILTVHETSLSVRPGETEIAGWVFAREWEIAPGRWSLQIWEDGKKLAEKIFTVTKEKDIYVHLGEWGRRLPEFAGALKKNPKDIKALNGLGNAYSEISDYARALAEYAKAVEAAPQSPLAYNGRCDVYTIRKEFDKAIAECARAIELKPDYAFALINRGKAHDGKGDYIKAAADYTRAIELNPRYSNAYFYRALALARQGDMAGAKADFEKVLELNPYDARARKKLEDL